jgi:predicted HD phosphohydrolase
MGERVAYLISAHADAKRYLVSTRPDYLARLSPVSRESFELQGGLMTAAEVQRFASHPDVDKAVLLRRADDAAKSAGRPVPGLEAWVEALRATARTVP